MKWKDAFNESFLFRLEVRSLDLFAFGFFFFLELTETEQQ